MARILVVDDSSFARLRICNLLQDAGHQTEEAENGRLGLAKVLAASPDCIVTDLLMPELDGIGLLKALREQGLAVPVIVLTADIQESRLRECYDLGAKRFLSKPPQQKALLAALEQVLAGGEAQP